MQRAVLGGVCLPARPVPRGATSRTPLLAAMPGAAALRALGALPARPRRAQRPARAGASAVVCAASAGMENPYKYPREMDGLTAALAALPSAGVYALGAALVVALGGGASAAAQSLAPESLRAAARAAAAAAGAAAGAWAALQLAARRRAAFAVELTNLLVSLGDPAALTREAVAALEAKYGAPLAEACPEEARALYGVFVEAAIPGGDAPLRGDEAALIRAFKAALGLDDVAAAPAHLEVGRRALRGRLEAGSRAEDVGARRAFQKLIYVSGLVFGDRQAAFLLPWARVFGLTDAQVAVARRDNARALFKAAVAAGGLLRADADALRALRAAQAEFRLEDAEAAAVVAEAAQAALQAALERAIEGAKARTRARDFSGVVAAADEAIALNRGLAALAASAAPGELPPGLKAQSVMGSPWEAAEGRSKDLREVFRIYVEERAARDGAFTDALEADAADLQLLAGLGKKEAADVVAGAQERAYRRLLREEVASGRLDAAPSKAEVLSDLLERVRFDGDAAKELHRGLYRQKLSSLLEKGSLSEGDDAELARLQRLLCIPTPEREAVDAELKGGRFREKVAAALGAGVEGFGHQDRDELRAARAALRIAPAAARAVVSEVGRKSLLAFITASRLQRDRVAQARELKKMVLFSSLVLAPVLDDLKTPEEREAAALAEKQQAEIQELMAEARRKADAAEARKAAGLPAEVEAVAPAAGSPAAAAAAAPTARGRGGGVSRARAAELAKAAKAAPAPAPAAVGAAAPAGGDTPASLERARSAAGSEAAAAAPAARSQREVTLAADLDAADRKGVYKQYLLYCMTGDVVQGPMGVQMVTERDDSEFARLAALGDVLGLDQMAVAEVHQGLAEQAFKAQVQSVASDGMLTPERAAALEDLRAKMGLPKEAADKIVRGFQNQKMISGLQAAKAQGALTLARVLELKEAGADTAALLSKEQLFAMYSAEVQARLTDGTGDFDAPRLLDELPAELGLDLTKARKAAAELAAERQRTTLVQAVSFLRQRKAADAVRALNSLRACAAAAPDAKPVSWDEEEEIADMYSLYCAKEEDATRRAGVQAALGLSDADAEVLRGVVGAGAFKLGGGEADEDEAALF